MPDAPQTPLDRERWLSEAKEFVTRCVPQADPIRNRIAAYQIASHLGMVWSSIQKTDFSKWRGAFAPFPEDGDWASSGPAEAEVTAHAAGGKAKQPAGPEPSTRCEIADLYFWLGAEAEIVGFTPWETVWLLADAEQEFANRMHRDFEREQNA